ncbi:hypothetical protein M433DRAFT_140137 [Acidomyces richmondensis BFW]|nr:MAG: hypothetical protein FE78DRAFT_78199 [Acidomyces sp. 'richmondensis']KYG49384.1 hypothetical protein M433DRAFT_140137 [Acidomyces richmondensis BFW]
MSVMQRADQNVTDRSAGVLRLNPTPSTAQTLITLSRSSKSQFARPVSWKNLKHRRQQRLSQGQSDMISPDEYAALPPLIQKKYFSSGERLKIAQQAAVDKRIRHRRKETCVSSTSPSDRSTRPKSAQGLCNSSTVCLTLGCLCAQPLERDPISESQARFFLSLPDKLRRQHFTKEELQLLTQHSHEVLERSFQVEHEGLQSRRSTLSVENEGSLADEPASTLASDLATESDVALPVGSTEHLEHVSPLFWLQENFRSETYISSSHTQHRTPVANPNTAIPQPPPNCSTFLPSRSHAPIVSRRPKIRSLSLTPLSLPPPILAPAPPLPSPSTLRSFVVSNKVSYPHSEFTTFLNPQAQAFGKFGQDSEARQQTQTLSLPQKPDKTDGVSLPVDVLMPSSASTVSSFPIQGAESLHSHGTEEDGSVDTRGPPTPPLSGLARLIKQSASLEFGNGLASHPLIIGKDMHDIYKRDSPATASSFDMPMHVTSIQPEDKLEDNIYSCQRTHSSGGEIADADPLALDPLPVCDDPTGAHGAFALNDLRRKRGLKNMWKSFRFR